MPDAPNGDIRDILVRLARVETHIESINGRCDARCEIGHTLTESLRSLSERVAVLVQRMEDVTHRLSDGSQTFKLLEDRIGRDEREVISGLSDVRGEMKSIAVKVGLIFGMVILTLNAIIAALLRRMLP